MIVFLTNGGSWKKVSKRKKFRLEFGAEELAFEDDFRIGIQIKHMRKTKESQLKLFSHMYDSDIIIGSPISMRMMTGQEQDENKKFDSDFLSSIQIVMLDQSEAFLFQNPEHLEELMKVLNKQPKKLSGLNDIMRLREAYSNTANRKWPVHIRQNIIIQRFKSQDLQYIYQEFCNKNAFG